MGWDDVSLFTLQGQPTLAALLNLPASPSLLAFLFQVEIYFKTQQTYFASGPTDFACLDIAPAQAEGCSGAVDAPLQEAEPMPAACPSHFPQDFGHSFS